MNVSDVLRMMQSQLGITIDIHVLGPQIWEIQCQMTEEFARMQFVDLLHLKDTVNNIDWFCFK